jgi:serine/threonine protein kinase
MLYNRQHNTAISLKLLTGLATQILMGEHFLHEHNIIHRDIKPDNTMGDNRGCVKILDLGLSIREVLTLTLLARINSWPRKVLNGLHYGRSVDIWSFGMTLIDLWNSSTPFRGLDRNKIKEQVSQGKLPTLSNAPWLPFSFYNLILSCVNVMPFRHIPASLLIWHELLTLHRVDIQGPRESDRSSESEIRLTDSRSPGHH